MVDLLKFQSNRATDTAYMDGIYETVSNLSDLLLPDCTSNDSGGRLVKRAARDNLVDAIEGVVMKCSDAEIKQEASKLSSTLTKYLKINSAGGARSSS